MALGEHPERVDKLIYLDSGYDWSAREFFKPFEQMLVTVAPVEAELASLDAYRAWFRTAWLGKAAWSDGLEGDLRAIAQPDAGGRLHPVPTEKVFAANRDRKVAARLQEGARPGAGALRADLLPRAW